VLTPITVFSGIGYYVSSINSGSFTVSTLTSSTNSVTFAYRAFYNT